MIKNPWANTSCPNGSFRSNCPRGQKCLYKHPGDDTIDTAPPAQVSTNITVPERRSVRKKQPTKKYENLDKKVKEELENSKISPLCVGCEAYVNNGAFCTECQRWWHYKCAHTTKSAVKKLEGQDFICPNHEHERPAMNDL